MSLLIIIILFAAVYSKNCQRPWFECDNGDTCIKIAVSVCNDICDCMDGSDENVVDFEGKTCSKNCGATITTEVPSIAPSQLTAAPSQPTLSPLPTVAMPSRAPTYAPSHVPSQQTLSPSKSPSRSPVPAVPLSCTYDMNIPRENYISNMAPFKLFMLWHCGFDWCAWGISDAENIIDYTYHPRFQTDGTAHELETGTWNFHLKPNGESAFNVIILSFVHPLTLFNYRYWEGGLPQTMIEVDTTDDLNKNAIQWFQSHTFNGGSPVKVILSIGGQTYRDDWETVLNNPCGPEKLANHAAEAALNYGVGIEIDWEGSVNDLNHPLLNAMERFIQAYRDCSINCAGYDREGEGRFCVLFDKSSDDDLHDVTKWLTYDTGAGGRFLFHLSTRGRGWIENGWINFQNAMVTNKKYRSGTAAMDNWQEHMEGYSSLVTVPIAPMHTTGAFYVSDDHNCQASNTVFTEVIDCVKEWGMRGIAFWGGGCCGESAGGKKCPMVCDGGGGCGAIYDGSDQFFGISGTTAIVQAQINSGDDEGSDDDDADAVANDDHSMPDMFGIKDATPAETYSILMVVIIAGIVITVVLICGVYQYVQKRKVFKEVNVMVENQNNEYGRDEKPLHHTEIVTHITETKD